MNKTTVYFMVIIAIVSLAILIVSSKLHSNAVNYIAGTSLVWSLVWLIYEIFDLND